MERLREEERIDTSPSRKQGISRGSGRKAQFPLARWASRRIMPQKGYFCRRAVSTPSSDVAVAAGMSSIPGSRQ